MPALDDSVKATEGGKMLSTRERMEEHRKNPACNSCHKVIDPLGLALENFDVTGAWRIKDNGVPGRRRSASSTTARGWTARRLARGAAEAPGRVPDRASPRA